MSRADLVFVCLCSAVVGSFVSVVLFWGRPDNASEGAQVPAVKADAVEDVMLGREAGPVRNVPEPACNLEPACDLWGTCRPEGPCVPQEPCQGKSEEPRPVIMINAERGSTIIIKVESNGGVHVRAPENMLPPPA